MAQLAFKHIHSIEVGGKRYNKGQMLKYWFELCVAGYTSYFTLTPEEKAKVEEAEPPQEVIEVTDVAQKRHEKAILRDAARIEHQGILEALRAEEAEAEQKAEDEKTKADAERQELKEKNRVQREKRQQEKRTELQKAREKALTDQAEEAAKEKAKKDKLREDALKESEEPEAKAPELPLEKKSQTKDVTEKASKKSNK
jgi:hypothetical protein